MHSPGRCTCKFPVIKDRMNPQSVYHCRNTADKRTASKYLSKINSRDLTLSDRKQKAAAPFPYAHGLRDPVARLIAFLLRPVVIKHSYREILISFYRNCRGVCGVLEWTVQQYFTANLPQRELQSSTRGKCVCLGGTRDSAGIEARNGSVDF